MPASAPNILSVGLWRDPTLRPAINRPTSGVTTVHQHILDPRTGFRQT